MTVELASPPKPWESVDKTARSVADIPPPLPVRPEMHLNNQYENPYQQQYSNYGYGYNGNTRFSSSRMGGYGYGGGMNAYGGVPYGGFSNYGAPPFNGSFSQNMEASTRATFQLLDSIVQAFSGFAQMLDSTFYATYSSFSAMVGVVDQLHALQMYLGRTISIFALWRFVKKFVMKFLGFNVQTSSSEELRSRNSAFSMKPLILFVATVIGLPLLLAKVIQMIRKTMPPSNLDAAWNGNESSIEFAKALYPLNGREGELSFEPNDLIAILSKQDSAGNPSDWWLGRLKNGMTGYFPSNYVKILQLDK